LKLRCDPQEETKDSETFHEKLQASLISFAEVVAAIERDLRNNVSDLNLKKEKIENQINKPANSLLKNKKFDKFSIESKLDKFDK
jgi:dTDP-4-dehydrorhamnose reductase